MDSSSGSESGKALKLHSRDSGGISPRDREIETTSISSSGEIQPENFDGYRGDRDRESSLRLEMDLFAKSQFSATTSSYSSSDKYSEDYFRVMPSEETKTDKDVLLSHENSDTATASSSSTEPASMVSDVTHESLMHCVSPVRSPPPHQVMDRLGGYQPGRIPSSVFERSPGSTPVEWSIASNESLFSIHIGNISFSNDRFLMVSGELQKSGELPQFDEATSTIQLPEYDDNASDGPLAELERNFQDNEIAAKMSKGDMLSKENGRVMITEKRDDPIVTRMMPSLNNERHDRSSVLPV